MKLKKKLLDSRCIVLYIGILLLLVLISGCITSNNSKVQIISNESSWSKSGALTITGIVANNDNILHKVHLGIKCYDSTGVKYDSGPLTVSVDPNGGKSSFKAICFGAKDSAGRYTISIDSLD